MQYCVCLNIWFAAMCISFCRHWIGYYVFTVCWIVLRECFSYLAFHEGLRYYFLTYNICCCFIQRDLASWFWILWSLSFETKFRDYAQKDCVIAFICAWIIHLCKRFLKSQRRHGYLEQYGFRKVTLILYRLRVPN